MKAALRIGHLYPRDMNIYGDHGNVLALLRRLQWHGYRAEVIELHRGDRTASVDVIVGGGGQDSGQARVEADLQTRAPELRAMAADGVPMLVVCGLYQLFGHRLCTRDGKVLKGIGVLDVETSAAADRLIGNVVAISPRFGEVVGYENHSGRTALGPSATPLASVPRGQGNNGSDGSEGTLCWNVIGTYLHGSVLPRNPLIADWILAAALERRFGRSSLRNLDESIAERARRVAARRPR